MYIPVGLRFQDIKDLEADAEAETVFVRFIVKVTDSGVEAKWRQAEPWWASWSRWGLVGSQSGDDSMGTGVFIVKADD